MENLFIKKYWDEEDITFYIHFYNGEAVRQIEISPESTRFLSSSNPEDYQIMADQALEEGDFEPTDFITEDAFESIWSNQ